MSVSSTKAAKIIFHMVFVAVAGLSWFLNVGWIRAIFLIPMLIHAILFYYSVYAYHRSGIESREMRISAYFAYGSFLLFNVLLPDGGDTSDSIRFFFGLIHNGGAMNAAQAISMLALALNLFLIIYLIVQTRKAKRAARKQAR